MHQRTFEHLADELATGATRRRILGGLLAGAATMVAGTSLTLAAKGGNGKGKGLGLTEDDGTDTDTENENENENDTENGNGNGTEHGNGYGRTKVTLCHNGHTITVGAPAADKHIARGDTLGACVEG